MKNYILSFNGFINESIDDKKFSLKDLTDITDRYGEKKAKKVANRDMIDDRPNSNYLEDPYDYKVADDGSWPDPEFDEFEEFEDIIDILSDNDFNNRPVGDNYGTIQDGGIRTGDIPKINRWGGY